MSKNNSDPLKIAEKWPGNRTIHKGKKFNLISVPVETRDGKTCSDLIVHPGSSVILPLLSSTEVVLIKNKRLSIQDYFLELPAGTISPPEQPVECAKRELIEETGYRANKIEPLGEFYSAPGYSTEQLYIFIAQDLEFTGQSLDPEETILVERYKIKKVYDMIEKGQIKDAKTIAAFFLYMNKNKS